MSKMDAIVKRYPQKGLQLERIDIPALEQNQALIKIHKTAICGTDLHIYNYDEWTAKNVQLPLVIGHEFVGEIVEIKGDSRRQFKVGDIVSAEGHVTCGNCRNCRAGRHHLCPNTQGIGVNRQGIFAEYAAIPLENLWLTTNTVAEDMYAIFDPFGNATHTVLTYDLVGEDVLITGAGSIGIMAAAVATHVGARKVVITDINPYRLSLAKQVAPKAFVVDTSKTRLKDVQRQIGMVEGFDIGLEMSGSPQAFAEMVDNMIMGGKIAMLAIQKPDTKVDWNKVVFGALNIRGIYGRQIFETWHAMTALLESGLDISKIITHRFSYTDFQKGFDLMSEAKCGKVLLDWTK